MKWLAKVRWKTAKERVTIDLFKKGECQRGSEIGEKISHEPTALSIPRETARWLCDPVQLEEKVRIIRRALMNMQTRQTNLDCHAIMRGMLVS